MSTIGIVGTGWVGSSIAISALHLGVAQDLMLYDARTGLAEGEAMDLAHGASFYPACRVRAAAYEIIQRKGATNHAIGLVTASLLKSLLRNERRVLTVSRVQTHALGLEDIALSLPCIVDARGAVQLLEPDLDHVERDALARSATVLRESIVLLGPLS
jgi:malate/lactate dehydrogenase